LAGLIILAEIWPLIYGLEPIAGVDLAILSKLRPLLLFASIILSLIIALVFFNGI